MQKNKKSDNQTRQKFERFIRQKFNSIEENEDVRLNLKAVRLNYLNNLNFNKNEIIKLIENNNQIEEDIDFYRFNDAFQLKSNEEGQSLDIQLISTDLIAEEFFLDEEFEEEEYKDSVQNIMPFNESYRIIKRTSIQTSNSITEEQKDSYHAPLIYSSNQLQKQTSILQNQNLEQNNSNQQNFQNDLNDRYHQKNNKIQHLYRQKSRQKTIIPSNFQNQNINESQPQQQTQNQQLLFDQMLCLFERMNEKQQTENQTDVVTHVQKEEFFGIRNFDQMQEFTRYFPKSNYNQILGKLSRISQKKQMASLKKAKKPQLKCKSAICKSPSSAKSKIMSTLKAVKCIAKLQKRSLFQNESQLNFSHQNVTLTDRSTGAQNITMDQKSENVLLNNKQNCVVKSKFLSPFV
ncbi:cation channel family protein (macronuclear) [Tetrahymena thermophila SB210]|uniref:Cation channel family protein n=1 Tax=Tetrahymena thermophila (strain SB210) TaxID=312017 RepID=W7X8B4_TETTS|nr:cation channel family protein [Tetrahymena thermophila SB210]EWS73592.1 cation channel family protein [Tetrahymena thermophila SB210]|eukprot:XP_012653874.1 cation channel family protein [Tetrahymena thermophila SB210]